MTTTYPNADDYVQAVQHPQIAFSLAPLQGARFVVDPIWQIPRPASGNAAVVFRATVGDADRAAARSRLVPLDRACATAR